MSKVANHTALKEGLSLRWRVTLWTALVSLLIQLLVGIVVFLYFRHAVDSTASARLRERAEMITALLAQAPVPHDSDRLTEIVREATAATPRETQGVTLFDNQGQPVASTGAGLPKLETLASATGWKGEPIRVERLTLDALKASAVGDARARLLLQKVDGAGTLAIAASDHEFEQTMSFTATILLLTILLGLIATWTAAWLISGSVLRSLRQLSAVATSFAPDVIRKETQLAPMPAELAEFQQQIAIAREKLRESLCAQDRLISNVSHEMKTPIAVLLTEAEILDVKAMPEDGQQFVRSVKQEVRRLGGIIDSFVQFSRVRGGMALPEGRTCEINEVLMNAVTACNASAARRGIIIRTELAADEQPPVVPGDADLLAGMFTHMLGNCIRASEKGGEVIVRAFTSPGACEIVVQDCGAGVSAQMLSTLFDRFVENSTTSDDRRDIGLSIAQGIAELHGGQITASSPMGRGCAFHVRLPRSQMSTGHVSRSN